MNITIKQLEAFWAVAKHGNMVQAAEELFLTKGAVSKALQELEKQLNVRLFDRIHPNIHLNHEEKRLRPLADDIIRRCRETVPACAQGALNYSAIALHSRAA